MEKPAKHRFLNNALFTALFVPLAFFVLRDTIAVLTGMMFEAMGGKESFLYQINDDISRLIIAGLLMLILPIFFRGKCNFGFKGGLPKLGILLSLPAAKHMILKIPIPSRLLWMTAAKTEILTFSSFHIKVPVRRMSSLLSQKH